MKIYTCQSRSNSRYFISQAFGISFKAYVNRSALAVLLLFSLMLTACGGGGGGAAPVGQTVVSVVAVGNLPLTGQSLDPNQARVIEITGLTADTFYTFTITATNTGMTVFADAALNTILCGTSSRIQARSCPGVSAGTSVFIEVREFSGSAGSFELNVVLTPSSVTPLGSSLTNQTLTPAGIALIEVTGLTPATFYTFSMAAANNLDFTVFDDTNFFNFLCSSSSRPASRVASCMARPTGDSLFVRISDSTATAAGGSFDFNVVATPLTVLSPGDLPLANQTLSAGEIALYDIDGLTPGTTYTVSAVGTSTKEMGVFNNESASFPFCTSFSLTGVSSCVATPPATTLFVQLRNSSSVDDNYTFNLVQTPVTVAPLGGLPLSGQTVSAEQNALFEITNLTPSTFYTISIAGASNIDLEVHGSSFFQFFSCSSTSDTGIESCDALSGGTSLFVRVMDVAGLGDSFELSVVETPVTAVPFSSLPLAGQVLTPRGIRLYEITGLTPGTFYSVSTTGPNGESLDVYDDSSFSFGSFLCSASFGTETQSCAAAPSGSSLFLRVSDFSLEGDTFELNAAETPLTVTSIGNLPLAGQTLPANGSTLYEISGLTPGTFYSVSATGSNDKALQVFDQRSDRFSLCSSAFSGSGTEACAASPGGSSLFVRVDDSSGLGDSFEFSVAPRPVTSLALGAPALTNQTLPANGTALFEVSGLTAGTFYTVTATGSNSKQLEVINESDRLACNVFSRTGASSCDAEADGTSFFVRVDDSSGLGDSFEFSVAAIPVTPVALSGLPLPNQTLPANGLLQYQITGLTPNTFYTVSSTGSNDKELLVYDNSTAEFPLCSAFANSGLESCATRPTGTSIFVRVRNVSGLGDSFELNVVEIPVTPVALTNMPLVNQTLSANGLLQYQITGLTAGTFYTVSATGTNSKDLSVFDNSSDASLLCFAFANSGLENCTTRPTGTSLFVQVNDVSGLGDSFEFNVLQTPINVQPQGGLPLSNEVLSPGRTKLYEITGLTASAFYNVSVTGINNKQLLVFDNQTDEFTLCSSATNNGIESCAAKTTGTSLFVSVRDFSGQGDNFELNVVQTPITDHALGAPALPDQVTPNGSSLYRITGLTASTFYNVSVTGINNKQLLVFNNQTDEFTLCGSATNSGTESCDARPSGSTLFVQVRDNSGGLGDSFELNVEQTPITDHPLGATALADQVTPNGIKLYRITGLTAATTYTVSSSGTNGEFIQVYDDAAFTTFLCGSFNGTGIESCDATPTSGSMFVLVTDFSGLGDSFELNVVAVF